MIENNELAALDTSRLGNKIFVTDRDSEYAYLSLRGKSYFESERQKDAKVRDEMRLKYLVDAINPNDCNALIKQLQVVQIDLENLVKQKAAPRFVNPVRDIEAQLKSLIAKADCVRQAENLSKQQEQAQIQSVLQQATLSGPDAGVIAGSNTTKYLIYGAGGLLLLVAIAFLVKK
ncbi:MAG: hypothetical protein LLF94_10835 [Chlamydiales bacterium]|nr:hypothetical protein [Chlamydiales bacterium]